MNSVRKTRISIKLTHIIHEVFFYFVLPLIKKECPESLKKFSVNITSSVAYGTADRYSDIDAFILFKDHRDYLRYYKKFNELIKSIKLPKKFNSVCDKGLRFELESLEGSDISDLFKKQTTYNWFKQTEWLLYWLVNSITIYDPNHWMKNFKKRMTFFPDDILKLKIEFTFVILLNYIRKFYISIDENMHDYIKDKYFYKCIKRLMDIICWINKIYTPHPKWQFRLLKNLDNNSRKFYSEVNTAMSRDYLFKLKAIRKWQRKLRKLLIKKSLLNEIISNIKSPAQKNILESRLVRYTNLNNNRNYLYYNKKFYFKNYLLNKNDLNIIEAILNCKNINVDFYLAEETGIHYLDRKDYNSLMRIQSKYFDLRLYHNKIEKKILRKIISYLNFIIWRKIRVIEKAIQRKNLLNQEWYSNQVIEHLIEIMLRLKGYNLPNELIQIHAIKKSNFLEKEVNLLIKSLKLPIKERVDIYWRIFHTVQNYLKKKKILSSYNLNNPLITQFDIEYWKYENLRL